MATKFENWFAAATNMAILKTQSYWREVITSEDMENISLCIFSILLSTI